MTKVVRPLFSDSATGNFGEIGSFRMGRHGPEFIKKGGGARVPSESQERLRACFNAAKAAHSALPVLREKIGWRWRYYRDPPWPAFWTQWLIDHPECK